MFKIDLIVWKYDKQLTHLFWCVGFKIDLIVWKWIIDGAGQVQAITFKIDLIVWKFKTPCMAEKWD